MLCFSSWSLRMPHIIVHCLDLVARISCTCFLVAARHLSRVLPSNVSVVACPLLSAQASPFPSVFATGPVASSCHEHSEVFEPGVITFPLRFESELNCHQQSVRSVSNYTCILGDDPGYHSNISDAETLCGSRG